MAGGRGCQGGAWGRRRWTGAERAATRNVADGNCVLSAVALYCRTLFGRTTFPGRKATKGSVRRRFRGCHERDGAGQRTRGEGGSRGGPREGLGEAQFRTRAVPGSSAAGSALPGAGP